MPSHPKVSQPLQRRRRAGDRLAHVRPLPPEPMPLTPAALGLVLAEDVASDLDMPPYDKAHDGRLRRALRRPAATAGRRSTVIEEITAGRTPRTPSARARRRAS